jgi:LysR family transcriptional regulator, glycine cleavage system transcriptional activator
MTRGQLADLFRALTAFEVVARRGSFSGAGSELKIAQSAVSRHVARLEACLGQPLLKREARGVATTRAGAALMAHVREACDMLTDAIEALAAETKERRLTIASSHDLAAMWLISRINAFRARHPDVDVRLVVGDNYRTFDDEEVDLSLRFGTGGWTQYQSVALFDEEVFAVCAPAVLATNRALRKPSKPQDLLSAPLIHIAPSRGLDWTSWLRSLGTRVPRARSMLYPTYQTSLEAAVRGEGVALFWRHLNDDLIDRGQLVRLGPWVVKSGESLYAVFKSRTALIEELLIDLKEDARTGVYLPRARV